jgi:uncharacterized membrane protein
MDPYRAQSMSDATHWDDAMYGSASNAAIGVAVMIATAAVILMVMKKSGFKAMVAVGG